MPHESALESHEALLLLITGCWLSRAIAVATKLGIPDLLAHGPRGTAELALATATHEPSLYRLLRALASVGIFSEDDERRFRTTPLADRLRTNASPSLGALALLVGEPEHWRAWESLDESIRTGEPSFEHAFGRPFFVHLQAHPEIARLFDAAMSNRGSVENAAILDTYDFSGFARVVDVGGGQGSFILSLLDACPTAHGVVFDRQDVIDAAPRRHRERCRFEYGDFFNAVPAGADCYVLKRVLHDWDDDDALRILTACRDAMDQRGRLLLAEPIVPPGNVRAFSKLLDLLMLVWHAGGRERTVEEVDALLARARFERSRVITTRAGVAIIEAVPTA